MHCTHWSERGEQCCICDGIEPYSDWPHIDSGGMKTEEPDTLAKIMDCLQRHLEGEFLPEPTWDMVRMLQEA